MLQTIIQKNRNLSSNYKNMNEDNKKRIYQVQYKQTNQVNLKSLDDSKAKLLMMNRPHKRTNRNKRQSKFLVDFNDLATNCLK